jgi:hypothetical protein
VRVSSTSTLIGGLGGSVSATRAQRDQTARRAG